MEVINLEKFLFWGRCDIKICTADDKRVYKQKITMLFTINAIYFFEESQSNRTEDTDLENTLIFKSKQEDIYISNYEETNNILISYKHRFEVNYIKLIYK
jgi:hypothetical protein